MREKDENYIPALSYDRLTFLYDPVVRWTTREEAFKTALIEQSQIQPGQFVLDLACGTGTLSLSLKQNHPDATVIGIDGDPAILKQATAKAQKANIDVRFDEGLSYELPYGDRSFNCVVSSLFFHHLTRKNKLRTLAEVWRVLKPGGGLHIADWGVAHNALMKAASRFIQLLDGSETTADSFGGLLPSFIQEAGFTDVKETRHFNSLFGTIRLHKARKPSKE